MSIDPLMLDLPEEIHSERMLIRCPRPGDGPAVHEGVCDSLAALRAWPASLPWAVFEPSVESSERFCRQSHVDYLARKGFAMLLFLKDGHLFVGASGLHSLDWSVPSCEVGYWCRTSHQGRGLATEAVKAVTAFAVERLGARRITSLPDEANRASCRVAERAGFTLEGTLRNERKDPDGRLRHTCVYALTN